MGLPSTEWRQSIESALADGEWHELERVIREASKKVPPGKAYRYAEKQRIRNRKGSTERTRGDEFDVIKTGSRGIVVQALQTAKRTDRVEFKDVAGVRMVRDPKVASRIALAARDQGASTTTDSSVDPLLDEMEQQLVFWHRAINMMGGDVDVRRAMIGDDPVARIVAVLEKYGRTPNVK